MGFLHADTLEKHDNVGTGAYSIVYHVTPTLVVKKVRPEEKETEAEHPFLAEIRFFKDMNKRNDRCSSIIDCFLTYPDHIFLSYCPNNQLDRRLLGHQEREPGVDGLPGRLIHVKEYEDPALVARWIQQLSSALEFVETMGFCHNDLHAGNCLLDKDFNLKLIDFGRVTPIGQLLEGVSVPLAILTRGGPLSGSYGLCGARTEQFAVGSILYFMVYGHEPDDDPNIDRLELCERFNRMEFPKLNRHEVFDELISACWHNVWPTMALLAYSFRRKTEHIAGSIPEYEVIDRVKEIKKCEALVRKGILGPELALQCQPFWWNCLHAGKSMFFWKALIDLPRLWF